MEKSRKRVRKGKVGDGGRIKMGTVEKMRATIAREGSRKKPASKSKSTPMTI